MARIFISHSSANNAEAVALGDWLTGEGWDDLFLDLDPERGIVAGERWERALNEAANRCEAVLFIVSRAWLGSRWCLREFHLALKLNKRMFGILVEDIPKAELPAELKDAWQVVSLAIGADHEMFRARLPTGAEQHVTFSRTGLQRLRNGLIRAGLDARFFAWPPQSDPDRPPYRGLNPLEAEDAGIFFGREAPTIEALDRLRGLAESAPPRLLVILGASGAGKSSFLRAGLVPRLGRDDRHFLVLPILRPERAALTGETGLIRSLEAAARAAGLSRTRGQVRAAVDAGAAEVGALIGELAEKARAPALTSPHFGDDEDRPPPPRVVLCIDQGEELFLSEGAEEAEGLLKLVRALVSDPASNLIVLATVRSDAFEALQTAPELEGIGAHTYSLPPLPRGAYQTVIEGPAARLAGTDRALKLEPALTEALLADIEAGAGKDALPLLAFTLERLYLEHGGDGDLKLSEYREIGGIRGSIEAAVEHALKSADSDPAVPRDREARLAILRRALIPWLAGIDPETGAPRRRVARYSEIPEEARPLVDHLVAQRLLSTDVSPESGERTVEPAHEALLRRWGLLQGWLEEDLAALSTLEAIRRASREWEANARAAAWLAHSAGRLEDAEALRARDDLAGMLDTSDRDYLDACRRIENERRNRELEEARKLAEAQKQAAEHQRMVAQRTRFGLVVASLFALIAIGLAVFGFDQARKADQQRAIAAEQAELAEQQAKLAEQEATRAEQEKLRAEQEATRAEQEKLRAEQERERAEVSFAAAKQAVDSLLIDVVGGLRNVTGMRIETIRKLLTTVQETVDAMAEAAPGDESLVRTRVRMLLEIGETYQSTGEFGDAHETIEEAVAIVRVLAADPANIEARLDLASALGALGHIHILTGNREEAIDSSSEGIAMLRELAAEHPDQISALAAGLLRFCDVLNRAGDAVEAVATCEEALSIRRDLLSESPDDDEAKRNVMTSLNKLVDAKYRAGDHDGLVEAADEGLTVARELASANPGDASAQRSLLVSLIRFGNAMEVYNDHNEARAAFVEALNIARRQAASDIDDKVAQWNVVIVLERVGYVSMRAEQFQAALEAYQEALELARELTALLPNAGARRDLSVSLYNVGDALLANGDPEGALAAYEESVGLTRELFDADPDSALTLHDLATSLAKLGYASGQVGQSDAAMSAMQEVVDLYRSYAGANPDSLQARRDLAGALERLALQKGDMGDRAGALAGYQECLALRRELVAAESDAAEPQTNLVVALTEVAGFSEDPLPLYQESLEILQALNEEGQLTWEQQGWIPWVEERIAGLQPLVEQPEDESPPSDRGLSRVPAEEEEQPSR